MLKLNSVYSSLVRRKDTIGMAKKNPSAPPPEALPDGELNRYLARTKSSLCKRWTFSGMQTLYDISNLSLCLWALERSDEALAIAISVAVAVPKPPPMPSGGFNYNIWCPATQSHALIAHIGNQTFPEQARASRAAILANPGYCRDNPSFLEKQLLPARERLATQSAPKPIKQEIYNCGCVFLGTVVLFTELATAGDPMFAKVGEDAATMIYPLLAKLKIKLQNAR